MLLKTEIEYVAAFQHGGNFPKVSDIDHPESAKPKYIAMFWF